MGTLSYKIGDATDTDSIPGKKMIIHICNNVGGWGKGFVMALSNKWKEPEAMYRDIDPMFWDLGDVQYVQVEKETVVVNMIAQHSTITRNPDSTPIRYDALKICLERVNDFAMGAGIGLVQCPRIGTGLAGGDWDIIEKILIETLVGVDVTVFDLPPKVNEIF